MEAAQPTFPPRDEALRRHVARGSDVTLAAARRRIDRLASERARAEDEMRAAYIRRLDALFEDCLKHGERSTALRAVTLQLQLRGLDARSMALRARAERDVRVREDELRDRLRAELVDEIRAELLDELEQAGREARMREPASEPDKTPQTGTKQAGTKQDTSPEMAGPAPERGTDALGQALARLDREARPDLLVLNRHVPARPGVPGRRDRTARFEDAPLPCLGGAAGPRISGTGLRSPA